MHGCRVEPCQVDDDVRVRTAPSGAVVEARDPTWQEPYRLAQEARAGRIADDILDELAKTPTFTDHTESPASILARPN
jgi:hypothetical protein